MNSNFETLGRATPALLLRAVLSGCTLGAKMPSSQVSDRVESALHRSDHDGLITYYRAEAAAARDKVKWHRRLAASYEGLSSAGGRADPRMASHCKRIAEMLEQVALE